MKNCLALVVLACPFLFTSCNNDGDQTLAAVFALAYFVESTGGAAAVTQIEYTDSMGQNVTVMNPTLPWTMTASRITGESARVAVTGTTGATSTITARIQDDPALVLAPATYSSSACAENTNPCTLDMTHTF